MDIIEQSILGILPFLYHLGAGLLLLAAFIFIYVKITPYPELDLIRSGNVAAACSLAGATLGFAIPLAQATAQSGNIMDMLLWSLIALIVQVLVYLVVRLMIPNLARDIQDNRVAAGLFLGAVALATGLLSAASMSDGD